MHPDPKTLEWNRVLVLNHDKNTVSVVMLISFESVVSFPRLPSSSLLISFDSPRSGLRASIVNWLAGGLGMLCALSLGTFPLQLYPLREICKGIYT